MHRIPRSHLNFDFLAKGTDEHLIKLIYDLPECFLTEEGKKCLSKLLDDPQEDHFVKAQVMAI